MSEPPVNIYLDHAATTPLLPEAAEAMHAAALEFVANPASQHAPGRAARRALESAREQIGQLLGAKTRGIDADRVLFTSGGTEANNLAICGLNPNPVQPKASAPGTRDDRRIVISPLEHPSVAQAAEHLEARGETLERLPLTSAGVVDIQPLAEATPDTVRLVSLMLGNNETGVLQPVAAASKLTDVPIHTDATQAIGKHPVDFTQLGAAALTCTGHKLHGPLGIGVLLVRHGVELTPQLYGGFQQAGLRPGTEPVALAIGLHAALQTAIENLADNRRRIAELRDRLERTLLNTCDRTQVIAAESPRLPHIANVAFHGCNRQALVMALDLAGVACSTGSACASGSSEPSPILVAMGLPEDLISGSVRFSLAASTTDAEIDLACRRILKVHKQLRS